jgi:putative ABC transport system ATP-binding protein
MRGAKVTTTPPRAAAGNGAGAAAAVECRGLDCTFERWGQLVRACRSIDFVQRPGEWVLLVGPNGSGKSTLLRAIAGQQHVQGGEVRLFGRRVGAWSRRELARLVFYVNQNPLLGTAPDLTALENLLIADARPEARVASRRQLRDGYAELLAGARLEDRLGQRVDTLSGGQRQFLTLLIAELRQVPLILLDEPFAALDEGNAQLCVHKLRQLHAAGRTLLHVTHDPQQAGTLGERLVRLQHGVLAEVTSAAARQSE